MIERVMFGAALAALVAGLYLTAPDTIEAQAQLDRYCDMVDAWQDSGGEHGWPPYRKDENIECEQ